MVPEPVRALICVVSLQAEAECRLPGRHRSRPGCPDHRQPSHLPRLRQRDPCHQLLTIGLLGYDGFIGDNLHPEQSNQLRPIFRARQGFHDACGQLGKGLICWRKSSVFARLSQPSSAPAASTAGRKVENFPASTALPSRVSEVFGSRAAKAPDCPRPNPAVTVPVESVSAGAGRAINKAALVAAKNDFILNSSDMPHPGSFCLR